MRKAVFFDRDGVLAIPEFKNGRSYAVQSFEQFELYSEAYNCVARIKAAGFMAFVVTNQPDVGAGKVSREEVEKMHKKMANQLLIDDIRVCFHTRAEGCICKKPEPGMLLDLIRVYGINPKASFMVGDRASDVEAGERSGCRTIFIDLNYRSEVKPERPDYHVYSLSEATDKILETTEHL